MKIKVTQEITICNHCKARSSNGAEFNEYPAGETDYRGQSYDLCDTCVEQGFVIKCLPAGVVKIMHEAEF